MAALVSALGGPAFAQGITPPGTRVELPSITAAEANSRLGLPATPPFLTGTQVDRLITTAPLLVSRAFVFNPGSTARGSLGSWMLPIAQLRRLSRAQYLDRWAMPIGADGVRNDSVAFVILPAGTHLWSGVAGPIADNNGLWGNGGGTQYYLGPDANVPSGGFQTRAEMFFTTPQPLATLESYGTRVAGATAAVGHYLDSLAVTPFSDLDDVLVQLDVLPLIDTAGSPMLTRALQNIGPERHAATALTGLRATAFHLDLFARRGSATAGGIVTPAGSSGSAQTGRGPIVVQPLSYVAGLLSQAGQLSAGSDKVRAWLGGNSSFDRQADRQDLTGFSSRTFSGVGGMDAKFGRRWAMGIGGGIIETPLTWNHGGGDAGTTMGLVAGYSGYRRGRIFADGAVVAGRGRVAAHRRLAIPGVVGLTPDLARTADSRQTAWTAGAQADAGLDFTAGVVLLQPVAGLAYSRFSHAGFSEGGADSLNLVVSGYDAGSVRVRAGFRVESARAGAGARWQPEGQLLWTHALSSASPELLARLAGGSGGFTFQVAPDAPNGFAAGIGLSGRFNRGSVRLRYDGDFSRHRRSHAVGVAASTAF